MIYFISSVEGIKIGRSKDPVGRHKTIQTSCPYPCRLVLMMEVYDDVKVERELKERFAPQNTHGEWVSISFNAAFDALAELHPAADPFPMLGLPFVPEMDSEFPAWFCGINNLQEISENHLRDAWKERHQAFLNCRKKYDTLPRMIAGHTSDIQNEFQSIRAILQNPTSNG